MEDLQSSKLLKILEFAITIVRLNSVENKMHVLFHCNLNDDLRKIVFIKISERKKLFTNYNNHDKVCFLFNNIDSYISRLTATFIFQAFERRKKHSNI